MSISLKETRTISEISECLYSFLPGSPHPYADSTISFPGVAEKAGLLKYWNKGSKKPAITKLLQSTLENHRDMFCTLILEIVKTGMIYRENKNSPITKEEIFELNKLIKQVNFKIPELWDSNFLDSLPSIHNNDRQEKVLLDQEVIKKTREELISLNSFAPQERGFAFEIFLNKLFDFYKLDPRKPFRLIGEQIDGSFQLGSDVYLVEAKWQDKQIGQSDLLIFHGKVEGKSSWSRGLFISYSGFTQEGIQAFSRGRSTRIIGMDSQDILFILDGQISLVEAINKKSRWAAETGEFFVSIFSLIREY